MVKLVDMPDLGSGAARRVGSSPIIRTKKLLNREAFFLEFLRYRISKIPYCFNCLKYFEIIKYLEVFDITLTDSTTDYVDF